jgi:molecular chaperone DnaK
LVTSQQKLGEAIYANASTEGEGEAAGEGASEEDVVDAEVVEDEVVEDENDKK